jgi:hypothetical protein
VIWAAAWFAIMGIAPFAWPEHTVTDPWFALDATVHLIGVAYWLVWLRRRWWEIIRDIRRLRADTRPRHPSRWHIYDDEKETP